MRPKNHSADSMFTFLLLLIFCIFTLLLSGMGAAIYQNSAAHLEENYTSRTAVAYVSEKIRQHDVSDGIFLSEVEGIPALGLNDRIDGEDFVTYIYYYDGSLRELFVRKNTLPTAATGNSIVALNFFSVEEADSVSAQELDSVYAGNATDSGENLHSSAVSSDRKLYRITAVSEDGEAISALIHPTCN